MWKKHLPIFVMGLLVSFNYSLLRVLKDTVVITGTPAGASVLPFLKMWGVLPAAILGSILLSFLFRKFSRRQVFTWAIGAFLVYFLLFGYLVYPLREELALHRLPQILSPNFKAPIEVLRYWPLSLFYVMCEMWRVLILSVIFWGFVNSISNIKEAKRLYAPLIVGGSLAGILAGQFASLLTQHLSVDWETHLKLFLTVTALVALAMLLIHRKIRQEEKPTPEKQPTSVSKAFQGVVKNPILLCMSIVIICDYLAFNLMETLWKEEVRLLHPEPAAYCAYTGQVATWTGILGVLAGLFVSSTLIRLSGWTAIAIITPLILIITGAGFFTCLLLDGPQFIAWAALFGAISNCLCRAARQAFHSPAKEMVYLHLPPHMQTQGKTFVDGMSPALGKATGSAIQQVLLLSSPGLLATAPLSGLIVFGALGTAFTLTLRAGRLLTSREKRAT